MNIDYTYVRQRYGIDELKNQIMMSINTGIISELKSFWGVKCDVHKAIRKKDTTISVFEMSPFDLQENKWLHKARKAYMKQLRSKS